MCGLSKFTPASGSGVACESRRPVGGLLRDFIDVLRYYLSMPESLVEILSYCRANGRACPVPMQWNELYGMLPQTRQTGIGWEPLYL